MDQYEDIQRVESRTARYALNESQKGYDMTGSEINRKVMIQPTLSTSEPDIPPGNLKSESIEAVING